MEQDAMRHVLIGLTKLAREQHIQIEHLNIAVTAVREHLGAEADAKIDRAMRDNLERSALYGPSADETLARLDRIIQQLERQ